MKVIAVFAAVLAVSSASPQFFYSTLGNLGYHHGLTYTAAAPATVVSAAAPATVVAAAPAVHVPAVTKSQYHSQDELGQASYGHSEPTQAHAAVRDASGATRGSFSYISPEGHHFVTNYVADHQGYRVASNALPVAPSATVVGPVDTPAVAAAKAQHFAAVAEAKARSGRKKRGIVTAAAPVVHHSAIVAPAVTSYSSSVVHRPVTAYTSHVVSHPVAHTYTAAAAPAATVAVAAPATHVVAAPATAVRHATLTKVINTPGHAVSYRVD